MSSFQLAGLSNKAIFDKSELADVSVDDDPRGFEAPAVLTLGPEEAIQLIKVCAVVDVDGEVDVAAMTEALGFSETARCAPAPNGQHRLYAGARRGSRMMATHS